MTLRNIRLVFAYDGSRYHGWQRQNNGLTIQAVIEERLQLMMQSPVKLLASGRTDAGVHALNQVCNFKTPSQIPVDTLKRGLNALLPPDILVKEATVVPLEFHSRYRAKSKLYEYRILNRQDPDIFRRNVLWHIRFPLDVETMSECLSIIEGTHDFSAFKSSGSANTDPVRTILSNCIESDKDGVLRIIVEGNGFLRHMVRNIVGTLVETGTGRMDLKRFAEVLESGDRRMAGRKAPPQGLFLVAVKY
ncbi:MAG: tRNA pseudouridine(38-40) synthase TruA [Deltaproteobacteria bacterium]|nr:tRNA pseudouridine(38-40) synthase TruA [Deltaproteobacteria bacterium]